MLLFLLPAKLKNTMMEIYVCAGLDDEAEAFFNHGHLASVASCNLLIKSLEKADKATTALKKVLEEYRGKPDLASFDALINVWAESSQPDGVDQAFSVLRLMKEDPDSDGNMKLGTRPDATTLRSLLKCLSKKTNKDAGKKAVKILDEMESCYQAGDKKLKPNEIFFDLAIKTCLQVGDTERAELLRDRMEKSGQIQLSAYRVKC